MTPRHLDAFEEVVFFDSEYYAPAGHLAKPICLACYEWKARRLSRWWLWERGRPAPLPCLQSPRTLAVAYTANADLPLLRTLGWPLPAHVIDLAVEMRNITNGSLETTFIGLPETARRLRVPFINEDEKNALRDLAIAGGPFTPDTRRALLDYCTEDTLVLAPIFERLQPHWSLPHALIRGEFIRNYVDAEYHGLPINLPAYQLLTQHRLELRKAIAQQVNASIAPLYEGDHRRDVAVRRWIESRGWDHFWPRTKTGAYSLDDELVLKPFGKYLPEVETFRQAKKSLQDLSRVEFAIGPDGRNRYLGGLFGTITGRSAPKSSASVLFKTRWWRNLLKPPPRYALAYLDFSAQEFLVLAVLAQDDQGIQDYQSGDVYLTWGRSIGLIPEWGTAESHAAERDLLKVAVLGINYGMGERTLSTYLGVSKAKALLIFNSFRARYPRMYAYGQTTMRAGENLGRLRTRLDWRLQGYEVVPSKHLFEGQRKPSNCLTPQALRNWPIQSHAAEILRLAVIYATERGVRVLQTLHDALYIESAIETIEADVQRTREAMVDAGRTILWDVHRRCAYDLNVKVTIVRYPDHWREKGMDGLWGTLRESLLRITGKDLEHV